MKVPEPTKASCSAANFADPSAAGCATGQLPLPLLWDANYGKKSSYTGVMDALLGR